MDFHYISVNSSTVQKQPESSVISWPLLSFYIGYILFQLTDILLATIVNSIVLISKILSVHVHCLVIQKLMLGSQNDICDFLKCQTAVAFEMKQNTLRTMPGLPIEFFWWHINNAIIPSNFQVSEITYQVFHNPIIHGNDCKKKIIGILLYAV